VSTSERIRVVAARGQRCVHVLTDMAAFRPLTRLSAADGCRTNNCWHTVAVEHVLDLVPRGPCHQQAAEGGDQQTTVSSRLSTRIEYPQAQAAGSSLAAHRNCPKSRQRPARSPSMCLWAVRGELAAAAAAPCTEGSLRRLPIDTSQARRRCGPDTNWHKLAPSLSLPPLQRRVSSSRPATASSSCSLGTGAAGAAIPVAPCLGRPQLVTIEGHAAGRGDTT
jgi:hypothetical protein